MHSSVRSAGTRRFQIINEDLRVFIKLGLSIRQAQVYIANAKLGQVEAKRIAEILQVDRAEIYRAIIKLEKLGLTQRCLTHPLTFRATPITEATSILLQRDTEKRNKIEAELKKFIEKFGEQNTRKPSKEDNQHHIIFGEKAEIREFLRDIAKARTSRDSILDSRFATHMFRHVSVHDDAMKALKRGVKMRCIYNISEDIEIPKEIISLMKTGSIEIKFASIPKNAGICISDKKRAAILMLPNQQNMKDAEVIWSKNPKLVGILQDYFEIKWQAATEKPEYYINRHQL